MVVPIRVVGDIAICRDGGTLQVNYADYLKRGFLFTLPVVWARGESGRPEVSGYGFPKLERIVREKRRTKGKGGIYYLTSRVEVNVSVKTASKIVKQIEKLSKNNERNDLFAKLVKGFNKVIHSNAMHSTSA
ncbi:MAG: hypothetical protein HUJ17_08300 [Alcanivorax sp.]|nr:hypothetical protein [Alcanivorax sp.]